MPVGISGDQRAIASTQSRMNFLKLAYNAKTRGVFVALPENRLSVIKRAKRRRIVIILLCVLVFFSLLLFRVWISSRGTELACEIARLSAEKESLEEGNTKLSLEVAELKSPKRISRIAIMDLNMIRPSEVEVITLGIVP